MTKLFKLDQKLYSETDQEWQWTYLCLFKIIFNNLTIEKITITDHTWKSPGREKITLELILELITKLNGARLTPEPKKNPNWKRDHFVPQRIPLGSKKYKLVFWFKDNTTNHLWIRVCHRQD